MLITVASLSTFAVLLSAVKAAITVLALLPMIRYLSFVSVIGFQLSVPLTVAVYVLAASASLSEVANAILSGLNAADIFKDQTAIVPILASGLIFAVTNLSSLFSV